MFFVVVFFLFYFVIYFIFGCSNDFLAKYMLLSVVRVFSIFLIAGIL
jgi:hypothetical protein